MPEPMKTKLHYTLKARHDLDRIWDYIITELANPSAALETVEKIMDDADRLIDFPEMGAPLVSVADVREKDYRFLVSGNYLVFYRVQGEDVYVDRVLYGKRDYLRALFEET